MLPYHGHTGGIRTLSRDDDPELPTTATGNCSRKFGDPRSATGRFINCLRITKKDRRAIDPFNLANAEALIARIHADWGEAIGNYDEVRFFTGLRPSEQIALLVSDLNLERGLLSVCKARVLRRDKDRTKTGEDRMVELCPRAIEVFKRQLALRAEYVAAGRIRHSHLFFLEDGHPIDDPEVTGWRWNESLAQLGLRQRGPYHARHTSVTWQLMIGKNLLWVAKQHGHSVQVMLTMYAAWLEGATDADIEAIKAAMQSRAKRTASRLVVPEQAAPCNPRPPPEFGTRLALGKARRAQASEKDQIIVAERVGADLGA